MGNFRAFTKDIFYRTRLAGVLDFILFQFAFFRNRKRNSDFRKENPDLIIPPDYLLYETYRLDYKQFFEDGEGTAKEIIAWTKDFVPTGPLRILDWGCGISRVVVHMRKFTSPGTSIYGCDINDRMIEFNRRHHSGIFFSNIFYHPPTNYDNGYFDFIYALSVFTHIEASCQELWIKEMHRILKDKAVFLFTTHGGLFYAKLLRGEKRQLDQNGAFTKAYRQKGHRMMSTYNSEAIFRKQLQPYFEVLEFHDGAADLRKTGGQDLWIVRKLPVSTETGSN